MRAKRGKEVIVTEKLEACKQPFLAGSHKNKLHSTIDGPTASLNFSQRGSRLLNYLCFPGYPEKPKPFAAERCPSGCWCQS